MADVTGRAKGDTKLKKLIFLRNGLRDWNLYENSKSYKKTKTYVNIDNDIRDYGYVAVEDGIQLGSYFQEYIVTANPCILNMDTADNADKFWWNKENNQFEIYFVNQETGKLENIKKYTDKELRMAHNIEHLYLRGGLND